MFWLFSILILLILWYYYERSKFNFWSEKGVKQKIPRSILSDILGSVFQTTAVCDMIKGIYDSFDDVRYVGFYQFLQPILMIKDPKLIKQICVKDFEYFLDRRPFVAEDVDPLWGKNLVALSGQKWKDMRSTLSPSFTGSKMRQIFVLMHVCSKNFVKYLKEKPEELIELELKDVFTRYTNDIIASTAFGIQCDSLKERENEFYMNGRRVTNLSGVIRNLKFLIAFIFPKLSKLVKATFFDEEVASFFRGVVRDTLKYRTDNKIDRPDLLQLLMQAKKDIQKEADGKNIERTDSSVVEDFTVSKRGKLDLSLDDITSQALIFFFAGFETVAAVMCFVAYELAVNPNIQTRLIEELDEFRASNEKFSYDSLTKLPYLDMILSETLRKWPVMISTDRKCNKPYMIKAELDEETSLQLNGGEIISIPIYALHRDEKYWENPDNFDPERFSTENKHKIDPYTYIPFGTGPRNCIGSRFAISEVKVIFFELLNQFEIVPTKKSCIPLVLDRKSFSLNSSTGFWFGLKKRRC